jgi:hypothetical protein
MATPVADRNGDERVTHAVLETIAAFLNTEGGDLLIGVADGQTVLGFVLPAEPRTGVAHVEARRSASRWRVLRAERNRPPDPGHRERVHSNPVSLAAG